MCVCVCVCVRARVRVCVCVCIPTHPAHATQPTYVQAIVNACSGKTLDSSADWRLDAQVMYPCVHSLMQWISVPCVCNRKWIYCLSALNAAPSSLTASSFSTPTHPSLRRSCRVCATMKAQQKMLANMLQVRFTLSHRPFVVDKCRCECDFSRIQRSCGVIRKNLGYGADVVFDALACALALVSS